METTVDVDLFYKIARDDISKLVGEDGGNSAVIYNNTDRTVIFYVYNYIDTVYWISAQRTTVAPGAYGTVSAAGAFFKVHPNDRKQEEFLVAPNRAYVYSGPGDIRPVH